MDIRNWLKRPPSKVADSADIEVSSNDRGGCSADIKVRVKSILRIVCKHIVNVINALLKHVTKTVNYVVLNCVVRPLNSFSPFS